VQDLIRTGLEGDGILLATIDMPERTMNVFSFELMDALDALMGRVDSDPAVRGVVLTSGKSSFLAGADLVMVRGFTESAKTSTPDQMFALCGRLGRQFARLDVSAKPWVAAVNGTALGGGLELALACRERIVADDRRIQLGVPEIRWGLLPGAGGTQRLPRLAGMKAAMDLLLSGRSIAPADAVSLGIFSAAVPAANLLATARARAYRMIGQLHDPNIKYLELAQQDVPPHSDATTRKIATDHGVSDDDFLHYPAYGAIVDSVLKGARLPLREATDVEMHQFLRLMFNPVAGRMVRTLFLDRLRLEREHATPVGVGIERLFIGAISSSRDAWAKALLRAKLPQAQDSSIPPDTIELVDLNGKHHRVSLRTLDEPVLDLSYPVVVLSPDGPYGRVVEIVGAGDGTAAVLSALATRLRCLPWRTPGPESILQRLRDAPMEEKSRIARQYVETRKVQDPALLDVAACLAGVAPAWSGGPIAWSSN